MKLFCYFIILLIAGCANNEELYYKTQLEIARQNNESRRDMIKAMSELGNNGNETAKVASLFALINFDSKQNTVSNIQPPKTPMDYAIGLGGVLLPALTQFYTIKQQTNVSKLQAENALTLGILNSNNQKEINFNSNNTYKTFAEMIRNPVIVEQPKPVIVQPTIVKEQVPFIVR